jgi:hypothetical protein
MPVVWLRDRHGRWHTARPVRSGPLRGTDDFMLWLRVVPPLDHGTRWIDVVAAWPSAEVRARLPLSWAGNPEQETPLNRLGRKPPLLRFGPVAAVDLHGQPGGGAAPWYVEAVAAGTGDP